MYEDCRARLVMKKTILKDSWFDEKPHYCKVITYAVDEENVYLLIGKKGLSEFSLDALYELSITQNGDSVSCQGTVRERYYSKRGRVIVFHIQNGFYKNTVN